MYATIDDERARNPRLVADDERLQRELEQVQLELKRERQNKFATNQQKQDSGNTNDVSASSRRLCRHNPARTSNTRRSRCSAESVHRCANLSSHNSAVPASSEYYRRYNQGTVLKCTTTCEQCQ
jgi:hypothetical protein